MKIDNKTHWRSDQILALAQRVAQDELDPEQRKRFVVHVHYRRRNARRLGHAYYRSTACTVLMNRDDVDPVLLAHVLAHEMAHTRGVTHRQMLGSRRYRYVEGWREYYAWAKAYPIALRPVPPAPTTAQKRAARLERAQATLAVWERKVRLASNRVTKWKRRVRQLERIVAPKAADTAPTVEETTP